MPVNEYDAIIDNLEGQGSNRLGRAAYLSADVNPDQEANLHKLGQRSGLPVEALRADNGQEAKRRATVDQLQMLPAHSPVVADYLSDLDNARVAHDDVESLSGIEKAFQVLKNSARSLASVPSSTSSGLWSVPRAAGDLLQLATKPLSEATGLPDFGGNLAAWSRYYQQGAAADAERIRGDRGNIGLVERAFYSGVESFGQNVMTLPLTIMSGGSTAPMLTSMSLTTGGQAYGEARDKGVDILPALNYSASQGLIEYATEKIPALTLVKNLKAKASIGKFARDMFATEIPGEQLATALQDLNDWAVLNPEKPFVDYVAERPAAAVETLIATIVGTGGMVVTAKGLEKAGQSVDRYQHAQNSKNFLLAMGESAQASKLRERLPEKLQEAIKAMQEEHGAPEHAYVDAGKLTELWQSAGFDPQRKAAEMLDNPEGYFEALATGSEVAIPLEEFATKFTGEKYYQDLVEDVRLGTGSMTAREAAEFDDTGRDEVMNELIAEAENLAPTASDLKVYDDVFGQLLGTGMERSTAERNAVLMQSVFRTLGQRTGVDALELYQRYPLKISRPLPGVLTQREQFDTVLDQSSLPIERVVYDIKKELEASQQGMPTAKQISERSGIDVSEVKKILTSKEYSDYSQKQFLQSLPPEQRKLKIEVPQENRARGWGKNGESWNAEQARKDGLITAQEIAKKYKVPTSTIIAVLGKGEYHHVKRASGIEAQYFYHPDDITEEQILEIKQGGVWQKGQLFQSAWHGSPHTFDKFSTSAIGTGEGAQAYGYGLYFAGSKDVAEYYKKALEGNIPLSIDGRTIDQWREEIDTPIWSHVDQYFADGYNTKEMLLMKLDFAREYEKSRGNKYFPDSDYQKVIDTIKSADKIERQGKGRLYSVELAPSDDEYLLWDKPLSEQSEKVKAALQKGLDDFNQAFEEWGKAQEAVEETEPGSAEEKNALQKVEILKQKAEMIAVFKDANKRADRYDGNALYYGIIDGDRNNKENMKAASEYLHSIGIRGIKYLDGTSRGKGDGNYNYVIFSEDDVAIKEMFQKNRGVFRFGNGNFNIELFQNADLSTVLHESSHFYFEILADLVTQENAPEQVKADYQTLLNWTGAKDRASMTVAQLEQIARGFEAYIMEGNAPSVELQSVFSRMKAWLVNIYREIRRLNVKLNDDVRGVFDRLVATDDEIKAARERQNMKEVFATATDMGVSDAEFEIYRKQGERAHAAQIEKLEREYMKELTRQQREWWKEGLARVETEVDAESKDAPVYRAIQVLSKGVTFDGVETDLKLDRKTLEKQYGKSLVKRLPRGIYAKEGGLTADVVAEMFGFETGDDMVKAMAAAPSRKEYIKAEAERRMREIHGDLMTDGTAADEAIFAVHADEQAKVLHEELRAMRKLQVTAEKVARAKESENRQARKAALASIPPADFFKDLARDLVARKNIKDLMPHRYAQAESKAAREAFEAAGKKKWGEAAAAKQRQILNHYLYREAATIKRMVDQQVEKWERFVKKSDKRLAASRDMNVVTAARAVLSRFGIGQEETDAAGAMQLIQQYDPDLYESLQMAVDVATQEPKSWKDLNVVEFVGLMDAVNNLIHLSRRSKVAMIDGRAVALDDIREELIASLNDKGKPFRELGKNKAVTDTEKLKIGFLGMGAALRRVEHWITEMDRGDSGPFRRFIYQPIVDAVTAYRSAKKPIIERLKELFDGLGPEAFEKRDIPAQELGYVFANKGELLHAILHTGNTSNFQKLLIGRGWGDLDEQQNLDRSRWDAFLDRMYLEKILTQADYEFVQNVWDLLEGMKTDAQKAHHDMYGYYFSEITAEPVVTPFGTFRGGYVPAITDPYQVESAAERADQENLLQDNASSMFPATTGKGFTMTRVAGYNRPLLLDMNLFPSHVDKVLRFSHMGPAIQDVGRIIAGDDIKAAFAEINPSWSSEMLVPWLKRTARQSVEMKNSGWGGKMADSFFRGLRRRTGLQLMAANLANATQQLTGIFPAMAKVPPRRIGSALFQFTRSPLEMTQAITEKSPWMKDRLENEVNHLSGEIHQLLTQSKYDKAQYFGMRAGYWLSGTAQHLVDITVWQGAYEQAVKDGEQEAAAVNHADSIVRQTQGTFAPEDISSFEAGHPFVRLFTQFYSYFNMVSNLAYTEAQNTVAEMGWRGGSSRLFYLYMMTFALPSWLAELIMAAMRGKVDDDDDGEYIDDVLAAFFRGQGRAATAMIPGVGAAINAAVGRFTKAPYDDKLSVSPAVAAIEGTAAVPYDLYQLIANDKELKRAHVRDVFTMMGMLTGLPFAAAARPLGYAVAAETGATNPENAFDYTRGLITGYAPRN